MNRKILTTIVIIMLSFLVGCKNEDEATMSANKDTGIHYKENRITISKDIKTIEDVQVIKDGNILLTDRDTDKGLGNVWEYNSEEKNWNKKVDFTNIDLFKSLTKEEFSTQISPNGRILCIVKDTKENSKVTEFFLVNQDEMVKELSKLKKIVSEKKINTITFYNDEYLFASDFDGNCYFISIDSEEMKSTFQIGKGMIQSFTGDESFISILTGENKLLSYEIMTGKQINEENKVSNLLSNEFDKDNVNWGKSELLKTKDSYYLLNKEGIKQYDGDGEKLLIQGMDTTLGNSETLLVKAFVNDHDRNFHVWINNPEGDSIYKYEYLKNELEKNESLSIYSLYENNHISNMINRFSRENPNIDVDYKIGISEESSITELEAVKSLNAKVLSNDSPDMIVLDGLSTESYMNKGLLSDISSICSKNKNLLPISYENYSKDSKTYAVATKLSLPIFAQKGNSIDNFTDAEELINEMKNKDSENNINKLDPASRYNTASVLYLMHFEDKNKVTEESLQKFYELLEDTHQIEQKGTKNPEGDGRQINNISVNMLFFNATNSIFNKESIYGFDYVNSIEGLRDNLYYGKSDINAITVKRNNKELYVPESIVSVTKNAANKKVADKFLRAMISESYQVSSPYNGIPTNIKAINSLMDDIKQTQIEIDHDETDGHDHKKDENNAVLSMGSFTQKERNQVIDELNSFKKISEDDIIVRRLILDEVPKIIEKKISKEDATKKVYSQISIYNSEK